MRARPFLTGTLVVALVAAVAAGGAARADPRKPAKGVTVRGGYANDALVPQGAPQPGPVPGSVVIRFIGGSVWDGSFTGHTVLEGVATLYPSGAYEGSFTETFYGVYVPDERSGSLTHQGTFSADEHSIFSVRSKITGGTCGFARSSGAFAFDGTTAHGGYVGIWRQPRGFVPPASPCLG